MHKTPDINEYVRSLKSSPRMGDQVVWHTLMPDSPAVIAEPEKPWPKAIRELMAASGVSRLYGHQAEAVNRVRSGKHVVVATPTASGKTLIYNLPVLEKVFHNPRAKALYLFP